MKKSLAACLLVLPVLAIAAPAEGFVRDVSADSLWLDVFLRAKVSNRGTEVAYFSTHVMLYDSFGNLRYSESYHVMDLAPGASRYLDFPPIHIRKPGPYPPRCSVALWGDVNPENDTVSLSFVQPIHDVSVDSFCRSGGFHAQVSNRGTWTETFMTLFSIEDSTGREILLDSVEIVDLVAGATDAISFPDVGIVWPGVYTARCTVALVGDENPENDTASLQFVVGAIGDHTVDGRNVPQPLRFVSAPDGFVLYGPAEELKSVVVFDPSGRALAVPLSRESARLHVSGLSSGVYFVSTEHFRHKLILAR